VLSVLLMLLVEAQESNPLSVAFSDPEKAGEFRANLLAGWMVVQGYEGKAVQVEVAEVRSGKAEEGELRHLNPGVSGLRLQEASNVVTMVMSSQLRSPRITVRVPVGTNLKLRSTAGKAVVVEGVSGDIEIRSTGATVELREVSGGVVAQTLKGGVTARFKQVDAGKELRFQSVHGAIDVTLPEQIQARLRMETRRGKVFTNFELKNAGKREGRVTEGELNGGGPSYGFTTGTGDIYIRKGS